jgi:hypothetical protein
MSNLPGSGEPKITITIQGVNTLNLTLAASVTQINFEGNTLKINFGVLSEGVFANPQVVPEEPSFEFPVDWDDEWDPDDYWYGDEGIPSLSLSDDSPSTTGADRCPPGSWWCVGCYEYVDLENHVFDGVAHRRGFWCTDCRDWH